MAPAMITYSERYADDHYEYRHVTLPFRLTEDKLLSEEEWRELGVQQSRGWMHYATHPPRSYVMLFKRPKSFETLDPSCQEIHVCQADMIVEKWNEKMQHHLETQNRQWGVAERGPFDS